MRFGLSKVRCEHREQDTLAAIEGRILWTLEEKRRHEVNGHVQYDNRCEVCVKTRGILDVCIQSHVLSTTQADDDSVSVPIGRANAHVE